jgi:hypothetical protein
MIHPKRLGYGSYPMGLAMANLRNKYLEAHETFERARSLSKDIWRVQTVIRTSVRRRRVGQMVLIHGT